MHEDRNNTVKLPNETISRLISGKVCENELGRSEKERFSNIHKTLTEHEFVTIADIKLFFCNSIKSAFSLGINTLLTNKDISIEDELCDILLLSEALRLTGELYSDTASVQKFLSNTNYEESIKRVRKILGDSDKVANSKIKVYEVRCKDETPKVVKDSVRKNRNISRFNEETLPTFSTLELITTKNGAAKDNILNEITDRIISKKVSLDDFIESYENYINKDNSAYSLNKLTDIIKLLAQKNPEEKENYILSAIKCVSNSKFIPKSQYKFIKYMLKDQSEELRVKAIKQILAEDISESGIEMLRGMLSQSKELTLTTLGQEFFASSADRKKKIHTLIFSADNNRKTSKKDAPIEIVAYNLLYDKTRNTNLSAELSKLVRVRPDLITELDDLKKKILTKEIQFSSIEEQEEYINQLSSLINMEKERNEIRAKRKVELK